MCRLEPYGEAGYKPLAETLSPPYVRSMGELAQADRPGTSPPGARYRSGFLFGPALSGYDAASFERADESIDRRAIFLISDVPRPTELTMIWRKVSGARFHRVLLAAPQKRPDAFLGCFLCLIRHLVMTAASLLLASNSAFAGHLSKRMRRTWPSSRFSCW